ncbi:hypothetical protein Ahy_B05g079742 [Arachis hypogaea]|uniref:Replication protein A 70 kDa DNA-binding subunit B/D first OB fold domain-containing protein n=1 Tax=Arachis hypogaea TaxID=3818 RepID=A0A444ZAS4_ARAHY|nr:hypothetical protein Ahy_B05g079742 [Arachis hypogaea]
MVCLDENGGKIQASVKRFLVSRFVNLLKEGISYQIRYFGVGLNEGNFKTTHHEYVVNLNQRTYVYRLPESLSIPRYGFNFKGDLSDTPTLLLNLIDKTFLFIVEVQISDNPHFSPSYKVKKMTDNMDLINKFKKAHLIQIVNTVISYFVHNLLLEFSNEVADNDESEVLENTITPTKRLSSESEDLNCKEIPQLARRSRLRMKLENLDTHVLESFLEFI